MLQESELPPITEAAKTLWIHNKAAITGMGPAGLLSAYYLFMQG